MKPIQFKRNRGFLGLLLLSLAFLVAAITYFVMESNTTPESMYNAGKVYVRGTRRKEEVAVKITANTKSVTNQDGNNYYIIETEDGNYIVLETEETDTRFDKEEGNEFPEGLIVSAKVGEWNASSRQKWESFLEDSSISHLFESRYLLSVSDYNRDGMWKRIFSVGAALLSLGGVFAAFKRRRSNDRAYDALMMTYRELDNDFGLLKTNGIFSDDKLKLYIYKNHLVSMFAGFDIVDLREVTNMYLVVTRGKYNTQSAAIHYGLKGEVKEKTLAVGAYSHKNADALEQLFGVILTAFPHITTGKENAAAQSGSRQTISEFLEKQKAAQSVTAQVTNDDVPVDEVVNDDVSLQTDVVEDSLDTDEDEHTVLEDYNQEVEKEGNND